MANATSGNSTRSPRHSEHRLEQVLRVADLLLESGGFGLIVAAQSGVGRDPDGTRRTVMQIDDESTGSIGPVGRRAGPDRDGPRRGLPVRQGAGGPDGD